MTARAFRYLLHWPGGHHGQRNGPQRPDAVWDGNRLPATNDGIGLPAVWVDATGGHDAAARRVDLSFTAVPPEEAHIRDHPFKVELDAQLRAAARSYRVGVREVRDCEEVAEVHVIIEAVVH